MREQEMQVLSAKEAFRRGILRGNPVLMLCLGLFPAIMLATTLKAAAIVAVVSAVLLMIMELLTALVLKRLPFWLRIGIYALLSFGLLAGGLFACERFFPDFSGHAERLSATACGQCDDCVPLRNLRCASASSCKHDGCAGRLPGLCDCVAAARICPRVVGKRLYFRTFLFQLYRRLRGLLMPFGGFLLLGFMAAAVKWIYHLRHSGEEELATPVAMWMMRMYP